MAKYIHKQAAIYALINEANTHKNPIKRAYARAAAIIEQITAEDVQPVKRGKWSKDDNKIFLICSECKGELLFKLINGATVWGENAGLPPFCPCCGADMRGESGG